MAKSVLDIVIRTLKQGDAPKDTIKGLVGMKGAISSAMGAFAAFAGVAYTVDKALDATMGKYIAYGQNVRDASLALGLSADETSRVIALTDDLGISYDELSASIKKNADNTNYSIEGLANASAQYLTLADAKDRARFAEERYGKQWSQFQKLLEKGPDTVRAMAAAIDEGHLFDEADLKRVEDYRIATDQMNDSWESLAMRLGEGVVPLMTALSDQAALAIDGWGQLFKYIELVNQGTQDALRAEELFKQAGGGYYDAATRDKYVALAVAERQAEEATAAHAAAMADASKTAEVLAVDYDKLIGSIQSMQSETDRFKETQADANEAIAQANVDLAAGDISIEEHSAILADNKAKLDENAQAHRRWAAQTIFAMAQSRAAVDGTTGAEGEFLVDLGVKLGLFDQQTADMAREVNASYDSLDASNPAAQMDMLLQKMNLLTGQDWVINITTNNQTSVPSSPVVAPAPPSSSGAFDSGLMPGMQGDVMVPNYGDASPRSGAARASARQGGASNGRTVIINGPLTIHAKGMSVLDVLEELT